MQRNRLILVSIFVLFAMLVGCGQQSVVIEPATGLVIGEALTPVEPAQVQGAIEITGSSTVYPLTARIVEEFIAEGSPAQIDLKITGTGGGLRSFCNGDPVEIANASRPINATEIAACRERGREPLGFQVGIDALAVVVNPTNRFVEQLNYAQLADIFSGRVRTWNELDPSFPATPIAVYSPGVDSGTFDYFVEVILNGDETLIPALPGVVLSEDDTELVTGIEENPNAIGYFGFAYYLAEGDRLRAVAIDGGNGPVLPGAATVSDGSYPLARPLFIYTSRDILRDQRATAAFVSYYLQTVQEVVTEVGYFPVPEATNAAAQRDLVNALR